AGQRRQQIERAADAQIDAGRQPRGLDVRARDLRVARIELERDDASPFGERAREPDRAVAAERTDLEDAARPEHEREQVKELALRGRDRNRRQARGGARVQRGLERRIDGQEGIDDVLIDGGPGLRRHPPILWRNSWRTAISTSFAASVSKLSAPVERPI